MPEGPSRGEPVDDAEDLYRAITVAEWWVADPTHSRPSSAAFAWPKFSVNVASMMSVDDAVNHLRLTLSSPDGGIVAFNCGNSKSLGFDPRHELDELYPDNLAHAHVYSDRKSADRKRRAKRLAQDFCRTVLSPSFPE